MQLHQATPTQLSIHREHKARLARMKPPVVTEAKPVEVWPAPAPYPPRRWFFIEDEVPTPYSQISDIRRAVAQHYNVSRAQMVSPDRHAKIVLPRQIAMYLARKLTKKSFPEIGRKFGGKDHTTVIHAVRSIESRIARDPKLAAEIEAIRAGLPS